METTTAALIEITEDGPALRASRCPADATRSFPARAHCPRCWGPTEATLLTGKGVVETSATVQVGMPGTIGIVNLDGVPLRARLTRPLPSGTKVHLDSGPDAEFVRFAPDTEE